MDIYIKLTADHPFKMQNNISAIVSRLDDKDLSVRGAALHATYNLALWYPHHLGTTTELLHRIVTDSDIDEERAIAIGILSRMALLRPDLVAPRVEIRNRIDEFLSRDDAAELFEESAVDIEKVEEASEVLRGGDLASRPFERDLSTTPRNTWISEPARTGLTWFYRGLMLPLVGVIYLVTIFRWAWRYDHLTPAARTAKMIRDIAKVKFFRDAKKRTLYLRASMWPTANQVLRIFPHHTPISEEYTQQTDPLPNDWGNRATLIRQRDGYYCRNCGSGGGPNGDAELHVDHYIPRSVGGSDDPFNLRTLCRDCHEARHARLFES